MLFNFSHITQGGDFHYSPNLQRDVQLPYLIFFSYKIADTSFYVTTKWSLGSDCGFDYSLSVFLPCLLSTLSRVLVPSQVSAFCMQYWLLIPHNRLALNHRLQVACIRGSRILCMPLPANMHRTSQRGRRNLSHLSRAAPCYRV